MIGTWYETASRSGSTDAKSTSRSVNARLIGFQSPSTSPKARKALTSEYRTSACTPSRSIAASRAWGSR